MLSHILTQMESNPKPVCREGDLYKILNLHGHTFELRYGYYEDFERENPAVEPMPIYPDFQKEPRYTPEGCPFVTKMQDACKHYYGISQIQGDCAECRYYSHGDELMGICTCPHNRRNTENPSQEEQ